MRLRGCWHISGPSSRELYDRIRLYLAVFIQLNMATACTILAVNYTIWGTDSMATAAVQDSCTPVAYGTVRSPSWHVVIVVGRLTEQLTSNIVAYVVT